ncbi:hypothetical protein CUB19_gp7 [Stenotrophomonas phage CUB19]|nr:hypothetical protein CUB19_gp7 [Stenotrophomonas phage CUB19]
MTNVTNNYNRNLGLPNGVVIASGESADVAGWDKLSKHKVVAKWLESGVLSTGKSSKKDEPEVVANVQITEQQPDEDAQKEELIAQLAELGVKADKRSSVEKLQEKLDEALAN